jgi:hypothetical protein
MRALNQKTRVRTSIAFATPADAKRPVEKRNGDGGDPPFDELRGRTRSVF